ncbi:MAG: DUF1643 domain-containing protein [Candidatus Dormibacteraceae bacterium]
MSLTDDAHFSSDGRYRYWLTRAWAPLPWLNFICLNPSTADAKTDDATVRKLRAFAQRWGFGGFCLTNLFAYRSTDPRRLRAASDPIGPDNDRWILNVASQASTIVLAWGAVRQRERAVRVLKLLDSIRVPSAVGLYCLSVTKAGQPGHPLYLRGDSVMHPFGSQAEST